MKDKLRFRTLYKVLECIWLNPNKPISYLAKKVDVILNTFSKTKDLLEKEELIKTERWGRVCCVTITQKGEKLLMSMKKVNSLTKVLD